MAEKKYLLKLNKLILVFYFLFNLQRPQNNGIVLPPCLPLPACHTSTPHSLPSRMLIFGLLLCRRSSIGSRLRPRPCPSLYFFVIPFSRSKRWDNAPSRDPTRLCLNSNVPSIVATNSQLIVMFCRLMATT
jgi:hypothetical protein